METETIDRLFLELSQVTQAVTVKEIALQVEVQRLRSLLEKANAVIEAARDVVAWDWSENEANCVADIKALLMALDDLTPNVKG